jgi:hypothetical protein
MNETGMMMAKLGVLYDLVAEIPDKTVTWLLGEFAVSGQTRIDYWMENTKSLDIIIASLKKAYQS